MVEFGTENSDSGNAGAEQDVYLYVYDLSKGLAKAMSLPLLGRQVDGIWHTGVVVYGAEYYFGGGINMAIPGRSPFGQPQNIIKIGTTQLPHDVFIDYLHEIKDRYTMETYSLLSHNCNNFSDEVCQFLTGEQIPAHITSLPADVMNTPMGQMLLPMIQQMQSALNEGSRSTPFE